MENWQFIYSQSNIIIGIVAFLVIYGCASIEYLWGPKSSWLIYLGGASYSLYLIHPVVAPLAPTLLNKLNIRWSFLSVVLGITMALAGGLAFYKFCEKPITEVLTKWAKKRKLI
jgi:exopolysaccharide production protein ExoZ